MRRLVLLFLVGGCDVVFRLDDVRTPATTDGAVARDADQSTVDAATPCLDPGADIPLLLVADTWLDSAPKGNAAVLYGAGGSHILLTFATGGYDIASLDLELTAAVFARGCALSDASCAACTVAEGDFVVYLSRPDWDEYAATTSELKPGTPWGGLAGTGQSDRVAPVVASLVAAKLRHSRQLTSEQLPASWDRSKISFHIEAAGGSAYFHSREGQTCTDPVVIPRLTVRCR